MKVVIPGGTGQVGSLLSRALAARGDEVVVLSRGGEAGVRTVAWDGRTPGPWVREIDGADVVINLAGRSVNCRYTRANLDAMMSSRVDSTRAVGLAIEQAVRPPRVWLQMSTATIYAHRLDAPNDENSGLLGGDESGVPRYWTFSTDIARAWERAQEEARVPLTRKVALRSAMVMSPGPWWHLRRPPRADARRAGRNNRRRTTVRLLDSRTRLHARHRVADRARRPRGAREPRIPLPASATRLHGRSARCQGGAHRIAGHAVDGRARRLLPEDRHGAHSEEPPGRARTAARRWVSLRLSANGRPAAQDLVGRWH